MPGCRSQTSPGGTCPRTININIISNLCTIDREGGQREDDRDKDPQRGRGEDHHQHQGVAQDGQQPREDGHGPHHHHHKDQGEDGVQGDKAVQPACRNGMPETPSQAPPGGTSPRTIKNDPVSNHHTIEAQPAQHLLKRTEDKEEYREENHCNEDLGPTWAPGCREEDNRRYRELLKYMEDRRLEAREMLRREEDRKKEAKQKKDRWNLLRTSIEFLKEKEWGWRQRRIEEIERIREEEKKDRLAVVREKKKRYGIPKLSKEENLRLKLRTEDRMMIARAKENLWKRFREKEGVKEIEEEELNAWKDVQSMVIELEEEGSWRNPRTNIREIQIRKGKFKVEEIAKKEVAKKVYEGSKEEVTKKEVARKKNVMKEVTKNATEKEVPRRAKMTMSLGTERTEFDMIRERILKKEKKVKNIEPEKW